MDSIQGSVSKLAFRHRDQPFHRILVSLGTALTTIRAPNSASQFWMVVHIVSNSLLIHQLLIPRFCDVLRTNDLTVIGPLVSCGFADVPLGGCLQLICIERALSIIRHRPRSPTPYFRRSRCGSPLLASCRQSPILPYLSLPRPSPTHRPVWPVGRRPQLVTRRPTLVALKNGCSAVVRIRLPPALGARSVPRGRAPPPPTSPPPARPGRTRPDSERGPPLECPQCTATDPPSVSDACQGQAHFRPPEARRVRVPVGPVVLRWWTGSVSS